MSQPENRIPRKEEPPKITNVTVFLTPEMAEYFENVVTRENQKRSDPATWLELETWINYIIRDVYVQQMSQLVAGQSASRWVQEFGGRYAPILRDAVKEELKKRR